MEENTAFEMLHESIENENISQTEANRAMNFFFLLLVNRKNVNTLQLYANFVRWFSFEFLEKPE